MDKGFALLLAYCLVREIFFVLTTHKLINKLMSRDYSTYQYSNEAYKRQEPRNITVPQDLEADLNVLNEMLPQ